MSHILKAIRLVLYTTVDTRIYFLNIPPYLIKIALHFWIECQVERPSFRICQTFLQHCRSIENFEFQIFSALSKSLLLVIIITPLSKYLQ